MLEADDFGRVILKSPYYPRSYIFGLSLFASLIAVGSAVSSVPSNVHLIGRLKPTLGTGVVNAPMSSSVSRMFVHTGDNVKRGQHLMLLGKSISVGDRDVDRATSVNAEAIRSENIAITRSAVSRLTEHLRRLIDAKTALVLQIGTEGSRLSITKAKLALSSQSIQRTGSLVERGFISRVQLETLRYRQLDLRDEEIENRQRVLLLKKEMASLDDDIESTRNSIKEEEHKGALSELQADQSRLDATRSSYYVDAPIDGVILDMRVSTGRAVMPGTPLTVIGTHSPLGIEVFIPSNEIAQFKLGQPARAVVNTGQAGKETRITGRIIEISGTPADSQILEIPELNPRISYFTAMVRLDNTRDVAGFLESKPRAGNAVDTAVQVGSERLIGWAFYE